MSAQANEDNLPATVLTMSAVDVANRIKQGEESSVEVVEAALAAIERGNAEIGAVVEVRAEAALREAEEADRTRRSSEKPFHGVPITVKEAFDVAGMRTTWGDPTFADYVADSDATVVQRLRAAGAIVLGKTNVPTMLGDFGQTSNEIYGTTNNPWDTGLSPGGSSGGSAAALAASMSFLEYGSDLAGSIRIPASFCGVYGLKPSVGIVPTTGLNPPGAPPPLTDLGNLLCVGPLGRSIRDLRSALQVTAGPERPRDLAHTWHLPPARRQRLADHRVGIVLDDRHCPVSSEVGDILSDAVDSLARAGVSVVEGWPEGVDPGAQHRAFGFQIDLFLDLQSPDGPSSNLSQILEQEAYRTSAQQAWAGYFDAVDVFLTPTTFTTPYPHDHRPLPERVIDTPEGPRPYTDQTFWISHASLAGLPALSSPVGASARGLPVGLQVMGPIFEEDTVLTFTDLATGEIGHPRDEPH